MKRIFFTVALCLTVYGYSTVAFCSSPISQFYKGAADAKALPDYEPVSEKIKIYSSDNLDRDKKDYLQKGYTVIGSANFAGTTPSVNNNFQLELQNNLLSQAQDINAHIVLFKQAPYSDKYSDFTVLFLAKVYFQFGIHLIPLDDAARNSIRGNKRVTVDWSHNEGAMVYCVVNGSPAYQADILEGDILLTIEGETVQTPQHFKKLIDKYAGQTVSFEIVRNGQHIHKKIGIKSFSKTM